MPDVRRRLVDNAIERMIAAVEHIRDCERCCRVYRTAFTAMSEAQNYEPHPWQVLQQCSRELHDCERWPAGI